MWSAAAHRAAPPPTGAARPNIRNAPAQSAQHLRPLTRLAVLAPQPATSTGPQDSSPAPSAEEEDSSQVLLTAPEYASIVLDEGGEYTASAEEDPWPRQRSRRHQQPPALWQAPREQPQLLNLPQSQQPQDTPVRTQPRARVRPLVPSSGPPEPSVQDGPQSTARQAGGGLRTVLPSMPQQYAERAAFADADLTARIARARHVAALETLLGLHRKQTGAQSPTTNPPTPTHITDIHLSALLVKLRALLAEQKQNWQDQPDPRSTPTRAQALVRAVMDKYPDAWRESGPGTAATVLWAATQARLGLRVSVTYQLLERVGIAAREYAESRSRDLRSGDLGRGGQVSDIQGRESRNGAQDRLGGWQGYEPTGISNAVWAVGTTYPSVLASRLYLLEPGIVIALPDMTFAQLSALVWGLSGVGQPLPESVTEAVTEELYSRDWCACGPRDLLTLCNAFTRWHTTMSAQGADVGVRKQATGPSFVPRNVQLSVTKLLWARRLVESGERGSVGVVAVGAVWLLASMTRRLETAHPKVIARLLELVYKGVESLQVEHIGAGLAAVGRLPDTLFSGEQPAAPAAPTAPGQPAAAAAAATAAADLPGYRQAKRQARQGSPEPPTPPVVQPHMLRHALLQRLQRLLAEPAAAAEGQRAEARALVPLVRALANLGGRLEQPVHGPVSTAVTELIQQSDKGALQLQDCVALLRDGGVRLRLSVPPDVWQQLLTTALQHTTTSLQHGLQPTAQPPQRLQAAVTALKATSQLVQSAVRLRVQLDPAAADAAAAAVHKALRVIVRALWPRQAEDLNASSNPSHTASSSTYVPTDLAPLQNTMQQGTGVGARWSDDRGDIGVAKGGEGGHSQPLHAQGSADAQRRAVLSTPDMCAVRDAACALLYSWPRLCSRWPPGTAALLVRLAGVAPLPGPRQRNLQRVNPSSSNLHLVQLMMGLARHRLRPVSTWLPHVLPLIQAKSTLAALGPVRAGLALSALARALRPQTTAIPVSHTTTTTPPTSNATAASARQAQSHGSPSVRVVPKLKVVPFEEAVNTKGLSVMTVKAYGQVTYRLQRSLPLATRRLLHRCERVEHATGLLGAVIALQGAPGPLVLRTYSYVVLGALGRDGGVGWRDVVAVVKVMARARHALRTAAADRLWAVRAARRVALVPPQLGDHPEHSSGLISAQGTDQGEPKPKGQGLVLAQRPVPLAARTGFTSLSLVERHSKAQATHRSALRVLSRLCRTLARTAVVPALARQPAGRAGKATKLPSEHKGDAQEQQNANLDTRQEQEGSRQGYRPQRWVVQGIETQAQRRMVKCALRRLRAM